MPRPRHPGVDGTIAAGRAFESPPPAVARVSLARLHHTAFLSLNTPLLPKAEIGIVGLDDVIGGGLARNRLHLLEGSPGTGKTTIALQFLMAGAKVGEVGIYVSLAETEQELRDGARSHGWVLAPPIAIFELVPPESVLDADQHQSLLYSSDLELGEAIQRILAAIERFKPKRVVIDSLS